MQNTIKHTIDTKEKMLQRKEEHISICQKENVESHALPFASLRIRPEALPEISLDEVSLSRNFLNRSFSLPFLITGMTGGIERAAQINKKLAEVASDYNIPMGLGSQKLMLKDPSYTPLFNVRSVSKDLFIIGNMGAVSLNYGVTPDDICYLIEKMDLNAFAIHVNALQESIQPEGERDFSNLLSQIALLVKKSPVPILVKEVGSGMTASTLSHLIERGVSAVDIGGSGGTSWSVIEGLRSQGNARRLGELFRNWGLSTEESLRECASFVKGTSSSVELVATGGIRDGLQVLKALACGARMVGVGLPFFKATLRDIEAGTDCELRNEVEFFSSSLRIAMFCAGLKSLKDLSFEIFQA